MKKNKVLIVLVLVFSLFLTSCLDDFLDTKPLTEFTEADFYKTPADAEMALVGCYDGLQRLYMHFDSAFPIVAIFSSDATFSGASPADHDGWKISDDFNPAHAFGHPNWFINAWQNTYAAIYRVNMLLTRMERVDWGGDLARAKSVEAQARFLRAYFYFDLVRLFERVPLLTGPSSDNLPQANPDEIYTLIAEDLLFASEHASDQVESGRVNKWAAKSYLARVYLFYTGYYQKTDLVGIASRESILAGLEEVIRSGQYGLVEEYKNLWPAASTQVNEAGTNLESTYAGNVNEEVVFSVKYNITTEGSNFDGNAWMFLLGLRVQSFPPYGWGWGCATVRKDFYQAFETGDARRDASIIAIEEEGLAFNLSVQRDYTGYANKKYTPLAMPDGTHLADFHGGLVGPGEFQDYFVVRYADVLLMAAEMGSPQAQPYLDMVRGRAGLNPKPANFQNIMEERRFEFAFEGLRYFDLLRQGVEVAANAIATRTEVLDGGQTVMKEIKAEHIINTRGFRMIPETQITLSGGLLQQNPGWPGAN
jgi:starch-binding outer membrane protein, SusD/RagB family